MEKENFTGIVDLADKYFYCVNMLAQQASPELQNLDKYVQVVFPLITFGCLTCEMYLKALAYKNTDNLYEGHDLSILFDKLSAEEQNRCKTEFNQWLGDMGDFDEEIERIKLAFIQWRYLYERGWTVEDDHSGIRPGSITTFMKILHNICNEYKRDLKNGNSL